MTGEIKCPTCKTAIEHLVHIQTGCNLYYFTAKDNSELEYELKQFKADGDICEWIYPKCGAILAVDEGEARSFMLGRKSFKQTDGGGAE